jgi:tetratricopeptide (TPR) repeat protein
LAIETKSVIDKKFAFLGLARCYQECKNYTVAIRCYKKLLQTAWDSKDMETEVQAYEGIG